MDIFIILLGLIFLGIVGGLAFFIFKEPGAPGVNVRSPLKDQGPDIAAQLQKKLKQAEEKAKSLEYNLEALQLELNQTKEKEKALLKEKSESTFNAEQYEKFKKDFAVLKAELTGKEETLEKEISERRKQAQELTAAVQENEALKKRVLEAEDAHRKAQTAVEALTKELEAARKTLGDQKKIVQEHTENKIGGEWVSRLEFEKVEKELKEKEAMIQKMLSIKKGP